MPTHTGFADVNGTRLYYELAGVGHPLILIHGFSLDTRMWDDQFEVFAQGYQVLRYDLRGFGKSAVPTDVPYTHPADLHALLTHLGIAHAYIVGLSLGGAVAVDFAVTYPDATDALIAVDAALSGGYAWGEAFEAEERMARALRNPAPQAGLQTAKTLWLQHPLFAPVHEQPAVAARLAAMVADYSGWHLLTHDLVQVLEPPAIHRLGTITAPTLVIVGERDVVDFQRIADILARGIPGAKKVVIPGVGHMANMEDPAQFNALVLAFLADQ
jgi:pimeloyl-ACP methyl ester carboxylesterase